MAPPTGLTHPDLRLFLSSLSSESEESSIEAFIGLLRRQQIRSPRPCASATAYLLRRIIAKTRVAQGTSLDPTTLANKVRDVGRRLQAARPRELVVGNIVRRVLGLIREEQENHVRGEQEGNESGSEMGSQSSSGNEPRSTQTFRQSLLSPKIHRRPGLSRSSTAVSSTGALPSSLSQLLPLPTSNPSTPTSSFQTSSSPPPNLRQEILSGLSEIIDELESSDEQIASYSPTYILPGETLVLYAPSPTVIRFVLKALKSRPTSTLTIFLAPGHPNHQKASHAALAPSSNPAAKSLLAAGLTTILISDSSLFAIMPRAQKAILSADAIFSDGSFLGSGGSGLIVTAAKAHRVSVLVLAGSWQLCPERGDAASNAEIGWVERGNAETVFPYAERGLLGPTRGQEVDFVGVTSEVVPKGGADVFVTNLGGVAAAGVGRVVREQYANEDRVL